MNASEVLAAIRASNRGYPLLAELVLNDMQAEWQIEPAQRRIDGLLIGPRGQRTAIEVKVTRQDYKRETEAKRRAWQAICHRFVYAVPSGLIQPEEVPDGIGLWWITEEGRIETKKRCRINKTPSHVPDHLFAALCWRLENARKERG